MKLYRNDGNGTHFTEVGRAMGVDAVGETRQVSNEKPRLEQEIRRSGDQEIRRSFL